MTGKRTPGRPKCPGKIYEFHFYYRFTPGQDPPDLEALLESLIGTKGRKRRDILRAALLGGARQAHQAAADVEDSEVISTLDDLLDDF